MNRIWSKMLTAAFLLSGYSSVYAQTTSPGGVSSGLILWLDANDITAGGINPTSGSTFTTWKDKSGLAHDAVSFATNPPVYNTNMINGLPSVTFNRININDGTGLTAAGVDIRAAVNPAVTVFTVYRQNATSFSNAQQGVWGDDNGNWDRFFFSRFSGSLDNGGASFGPDQATTVAVTTGSGIAGTTQLLTAVYDGSVSGGVNVGPAGGSAIYLNGKVVATFTDQTYPLAAQSALRIGLDGDDNYFNGEVAEMIVYSRKLTDCEIATVNHYLSQKYGTGYDVAANYSYSSPATDINGVGNFGTNCLEYISLSAKSSILTVSNPAITTAGNNFTFAHDNGSLTSLSTDVPTGYAARLVRVWRADENGDVGTTDCCFDLSGMNLTLSDTANFALLTSSSASFSSAKVAGGTVAVSADGHVCITGVNLSKGQYFTLAVLQKLPVAGITSITTDSGSSSADFITNDQKLLFAGTANAYNTVTLTIDGHSLGTVTADKNGQWQLDRTDTTLTEGTYSLAATANIDGFQGGATRSLVIDTTAPKQPGAPVVSNASNGYINTTSITVSGTTEALAVVTIYENGTSVGKDTADASGNWSYTYTGKDAQHSITVTATDIAGNTSKSSSASTVVVDTQAPTVVLSSSAAIANGPVTVTITFSEEVSGLDIADFSITNATLSNLVQTGSNPYTVLVTPLAEGTLTLQLPKAAATDNAGNNSEASNTLGLTAKVATVIENIYPVPATNVLNIRFSGIAPAKGRVILIDVSGQRVYDQESNLQNQLLTISVAGYPSGIYLLRVQAKDYLYTTKVIIGR